MVLSKIVFGSLQEAGNNSAAWTHLTGIADGFSEAGIEVMIIVAREDKFSARLPKAFAKLVKQLVAGWRIAVEILRSKPESTVLYLRLHMFGLVPTAVARIRRMQSITEINGPPGEEVVQVWPFLRPFKGLIRWLELSHVRLSSAAICASHGHAVEIQRIFPKKQINVVTNGAHTAIFSPLRGYETHLAGHDLTERRYVLFFGALQPWQGIDTLIQARELAAWPSDVELVIVGDGPMRSLVERSHRIGLLRYLGPMAQEDIASMAAGSLATVCPLDRSKRTAAGIFPLKVMEGMAVGRPVIMAEVPGIAEEIREEDCGILTPPGDAVAIAEAVSVLHSNPGCANAMGERGHKLVISRHTWKVRGLETLEIAQGLVSSV